MLSIMAIPQIVLDFGHRREDVRVVFFKEVRHVPFSIHRALEQLSVVRLTGLLAVLVDRIEATLQTRGDGLDSNDEMSVDLFLRVTLNVLSRDDGCPTVLRNQTIVNGRVLAAEGAVRALRALLHETLCHEVDELLLVDGLRPFDPHELR
jgi:hypothetical protein